jgi:hypothetical protein
VPACSLSEHDPTPHVGQDAARLASLCPTRAHCIRCLVAKVSTPVIGARGPFRAREMRAKKHVATYLRFAAYRSLGPGIHAVARPMALGHSGKPRPVWPLTCTYAWSDGDSNPGPLPCEGIPTQLGGEVSRIPWITSVRVYVQQRLTAVPVTHVKGWLGAALHSLALLSIASRQIARRTRDGSRLRK